MNEATIKCPRCGYEIEITEALSERIRSGLAVEYEARLRAEREKIRRDMENAARDKVAVELEDLKSRLAEKTKAIEEAHRAELELRRKAREIEERQKTQELELARKLDEERARIREEVAGRLSEEYAQKEKRSEQMIQDLRKALEEARRKAEQGSMERQGEQMEADLEKWLTASFPRDRIEPVSKGARGADVVQRVLNDLGVECGVILWESKNTKNWSDGWIDKLKEDMRAADAGVGILVTAALPPDIKQFGQKSGVWVTGIPSAIGLAAVLRQLLMDVSFERQSAVGKGTKMELLYNYLSSVEFRRRVETILESYKALKEQVAAERRLFEKQWRERERLTDIVLSSTAQMYGDMRAIIGASLPPVKDLELEPPAGKPLLGEGKTS